MALTEALAETATDSVRNVLFIMCDQLRWDALSCSGHSPIDTPNIDRLAERGLRYDRAFVQGAVCGSSRASYYTGRYVQSHGVRWNGVPTQLNQMTLGDHLAPLDVRTVLIGKTHMGGDVSAMKRMGVDPNSPEWVFASECGFEPEERHDGLYPDIPRFKDLPYNQFLRDNGFEGDNPWHTAANSVLDDDEKLLSGWLLRSSGYPTIVPDELSETAFMTNRAIEFMSKAGDDQWCVHLSFIKPHWPYVASDPYHQMFADVELPAANRSDHELVDPHPVLDAFQKSRIGQTFSRDDVRSLVYPAYLGLVKQIDDHLGRLFAEMERMGRLDDTMIVFCSDHGDYMGDHWMGDKDWLHEEAVRTPMIIVDPRPAADAQRGTISSELVEAIDLVPTFLEALGGDVEAAHPWLEGESLQPSLHGMGHVARTAVVCETDFGFLEMANRLDLGDKRERRATMLRSDRYKYILSEIGPDLLYDLDEDPGELVDRIDDPGLATVRADMHEQLFDWFRHRKHDPTYPDSFIDRCSQPGGTAQRGIMIGYWDEEDLERGLAGDLP
ncbi:MAG: arylsulfatase A-like enzyme [Candidatus Poriferisodalaceae bacterium]|jgi:arylsulfatase A-like enzyme